MDQAVAKRIAHIRQAITAQESLRPALGDATVEIAVTILRKELALLESQSAVEQRKQVTILFADLVDFVQLAERMDPEDMRDVMNAYFQRVTAAISHHGGVVEKFIGDAVMAVFGIPTAHESDPEKAVRAALVMQAALAALNVELQSQNGIALSMRVGISTGAALVTYCLEKSEPVLPALHVLGQGEGFTVVGDVVNLASRLENAAPAGGILISFDTYRHVRGLFDMRAMAPIPIRGKAEPVPVFLVVRGNPRSFRLASRGVEGIETNMIGRQAELQMLQGTLRELFASRQMQAITVVGEAGVGKSRLLYEFRSWLQLQPESVRIFKGRADQGTRYRPYSLIRDLFAFRFEMQDSDAPGVARQKLVDGIVSFMGPEGAAKAPFIGHLIGLDFSDEPSLQAVLSDGPRLRDSAFHHLVQFFARVIGDGQMAVYLEDIHWADDGSLELIDYLMREASHLPILLLCLARPALYERLPAWGSGRAFHRRLDLQPLSRHENRRLVADILRHVPRIPRALHELIVNGAEGNPFYTEELIKVLIEDRIIIKGEDEWQVQVQRLPRARVPATLTGVLQARLDALPAAEREVLQCASVIGRVFWADAVAHLLHCSTRDQEVSEVASILGRLQDKELIFRRDVSGFAGTEEFTFKQAILRDATYDTLLKRQRRTYHAEVAHWLVARSGERVKEYAGLIGEHLEWAGDLNQAAEWYGRAGKQAHLAFAPESALSYYQKAVTLLTSNRPYTGSLAGMLRRAELYEGMGEVLLRQARVADSLEAFDAMQKLAAAVRDPAAEARAWIGLARAHALQGDHRASLDSAGHADVLARAAGEDAVRELAAVYYQKAVTYYRLGDFEAALRLAEQGLVLAQENGLQPEIARKLNLLGNVYSVLGHREKVYRYYRQALDLYRELGDRWGVATVISNLGEVARRLEADFESAAGLYQEALSLTRDIGDRDGEVVALNNLGGAQVGLRQYEAAEDSLYRVLKMAEPINWHGLPETYCFLAEACLGQERIAEALAWAQRALDLAREGQEQELIGGAWRCLGRIASRLQEPIQLDLWHTGQPSLSCDASACFAEAWAIFVETGIELEQVHTLRDWAYYENRQGDQALGRKLRHDADQLCGRLGLRAEADRIES
jgi:class 3 adenylate cyclase/tetratricopeptide (TPR) repeat protein